MNSKLDFLFDELEATDLKEIQAGEFLIFEANDQPRLVVRLRGRQHDDSEIPVLYLGGEDAFEIEYLDLIYSHQVLPLKLDPQRLRFRFDPAAVLEQGPIAPKGALFFSKNGGAAIAAKYVHTSDPRGRVAIYLRNWEMGGSASPRFVFRTWTLSYINGAGEFVDLCSGDQD